MIEQEFINQIEINANDFTDELSDEALDRAAECGAFCFSQGGLTQRSP